LYFLLLDESDKRMCASINQLVKGGQFNYWRRLSSG
jgi:hypothetical protein